MYKLCESEYIIGTDPYLSRNAFVAKPTKCHIWTTLYHHYNVEHCPDEHDNTNYLITKTWIELLATHLHVITSLHLLKYLSCNLITWKHELDLSRKINEDFVLFLYVSCFLKCTYVM